MELQKDDLLERNSKQAEEIEAFIKDEKVLTEKIKVLANESEDLNELKTQNMDLIRHQRKLV